MDDTVIHSYVYEAPNPGKTLVILGGVHGDETCGVEALQKVKTLLDTDSLALKSGKLIIVPCANPRAYAQKMRFVEDNLNRGLYFREECHTYEDHLRNQLCGILAEADYLLDIHSYQSGGIPFVFISGTNKEEEDFVLSLGVTKAMVWGWAKAFADSSVDPKQAQGTTECTRASNPAACAITLECGQHKDPLAPNVAFVAAVNAMRYAGVVEDTWAQEQVEGVVLPTVPEEEAFARVRKLYHSRNGLTITQGYKHFQSLPKGEAVAHTVEESTPVKLEYDGFAILPFSNHEGECVYAASKERPEY